MAKGVNAIDGMSLRDLISEEGLVIDVTDELEEYTYEPYGFNLNPHLTTDEMMKLLNMEEFAEDGDNETHDMGETMMPWSLSFEKIRAKSEKLTDDGKVTKLVRQNGVGEVAQGDSLVVLHYGGYFEYQDEPFDSTFAHGSPKRYTLGQGELICGLELGIRTMRKHETAVFVIHPDLAYGELGCVPLIPPAAAVLFIVRLLDVIDGAAETLENLTAHEKKQFRNVKLRANGLCRTAAESFKRNKTRQAIREYGRVSEMLENAQLENDEEEEELDCLLSRIHGNLAICYNKEDKPRLACKYCLKIKHPTAKTHFHHGRALLKLGEYKRALEQLQLALKMNPENNATKQEIQLANDLQRKYLESEKRLWQNCLKLRKGEQEIPEYALIAREFCERFAKNEAILRQPLPEGLTPMEDKYMRQQAALVGLTVVDQIRYGKETTYLAKSSYARAM